ncbi:bifunctional [glutamate--ammonia ligase]-adenylyl-L-tyrosine phosphorylase/[glutamate--ammonia-ligase] adenylyltransferase, partial [bacterium]
SLQLIHGGRNPAIREKNSLRALDRLMKNGFLAERDAETLRESYIFLRKVEHRVQLVEERQTHILPRGEDELSRLAYIMDFIRDGNGDTVRFREVLDRVTEEVRVCYDRLFFTEDLHRSSRDVQEPNLLREDLPEEEAVEELGSAGFSDPEGAYRNLLLLRDGPPYGHFTDTCRHLLRQIAPRLLAELKGIPDPDAVLVNLNRFIGKVGARASYYSMLARNPESIKLLASLFGSSPFLSGFLLRQPDLLDLMVSGTDLSEGRKLEDMEEEIKEILGSSPSFEDELIMLRRYRNGEILRIGLGDLLGLRDLPEVNAELTALAECLLRASFDMAVRDVAVDRGGPPGLFGVVAMGKMGGREMNYSSDLDLIFLFQGEEGSREFYTRVAQRMITIITSPTGEGVLYRADMRLRPSGHAGPLVTTLDSFRRYHREEAMVWERQALTKARWVAGDGEFGKDITDTIDETTYSSTIGIEEVREIRRVRERMENEIAGESSGQFHDIKVGEGGLVDIEFAVQVLQLYHGHDLPEVRTTSTMAALMALKDSGLVEENTYNALRRAYIFYREIENRSQLYQDRSDPRIPADEKKVHLLARRLGYIGDDGSSADFLDEVRNTKVVVRAKYENLLASVEMKYS